MKDQEKYYRDCPNCPNTITYIQFKSYQNGIKNETVCKKCQYKRWNEKRKIECFRNCPNCDKSMKYLSLNTKIFADKNNACCKKCRGQERMADPKRKEEYSKRMKGANNPAYGKPAHNRGIPMSEDQKKKMSEQRKGIPCSEQRRQSLKEYAKNNDNPMKGKSVYSVWAEKYGTEIADQKMSQKKKKHSISSSGSNNPMFGKPSPQGSGNGWKGWYKNHYFRSLRELCFMIDLDSKNLEWSTGETRKIKIVYQDWEGKTRNYFPDFLVGNVIYELKPLKLINSIGVLSKSAAAEIYCKQNGLIFIITDFPIDRKIILKQLEIGNIKFDRDYEEKFINYISK